MDNFLLGSELISKETKDKYLFEALKYLLKEDLISFSHEDIFETVKKLKEFKDGK